MLNTTNFDEKINSTLVIANDHLHLAKDALGIKPDLVVARERLRAANLALHDIAVLFLEAELTREPLATGIISLVTKFQTKLVNLADEIVAYDAIVTASTNRVCKNPSLAN